MYRKYAAKVKMSAFDRIKNVTSKISQRLYSITSSSLQWFYIPLILNTFHNETITSVSVFRKIVPQRA